MTETIETIACCECNVPSQSSPPGYVMNCPTCGHRYCDDCSRSEKDTPAPPAE